MYETTSPMTFINQSYMDYFNQQPSTVKSATTNVESQKRYLWNMIYSVFDFDLPHEWALNWFRYWLFHFGSVAVIYTKEYGWIAQPYSIAKLDLYYQPKEITVTSPFLDEIKVGQIGKNSEIVKLFDDYFGLADLVQQYATILSDIDKSINISLMNANVAYLFEAENKKDADNIKEAYGRATTGEPMICINKKVIGEDGFKPMFPDVKSNFIVNDLIDAKHEIINEFLTKVGIKNANTDKKERLITDEVNQNNDQTRSIVEVIYKNLKTAFNKLNELSEGDLNLNVKLTYDYKPEKEETEECQD